jgi:hypothetical protein
MNKETKLKTPYGVKSNLATHKEINESERIVTAVVNTLNYFDYDRDVLRPGVAAKSMIERGAKSQAADKILHLLFHDLSRPTGKSLSEIEGKVDGNPVLLTETYYPETTDGEDTLIKYKAGIYNQHSIGFNYINLDRIEKEAEGARWDGLIKDIINADAVDAAGVFYEVKEIAWFEYSTVSFGANKLTPALGVKDGDKKSAYDNAIMKLSILMEKATRREIKDKRLFDLELKQLKQIIYELSTMEPLDKDTASKRPPMLGTTTDEAKANNLLINYLTNK